MVFYLFLFELVFCRDYVFHEFEFWRLLVTVGGFYAACRQRDCICAHEVAVMNENIEAKPVGSEHASGGEEGDGYIYDPFEVFARHPGQAVADTLGPGHASDERVVQSALLARFAPSKIPKLLPKVGAA